MSGTWGSRREEEFEVPSSISTGNESRRLEAVYCHGSIGEAVVADTARHGEPSELGEPILIRAAAGNAGGIPVRTFEVGN